MNKYKLTKEEIIIFYDRKGNRIEIMEWSKLKSELDYRTVAIDMVEGSNVLEVRTFWLGTDQSYSLTEAEPPLIFGTIIYNVKSEQFLDESERFASTELEALTNHAATVASGFNGLTE